LYDDPYDIYGGNDMFDPYDSYEDEFGYGYDSYDEYGGYDEFYNHGFPYDESEDEDSSGSGPSGAGGALAAGFLAMLANSMGYY